ncbi:neuralized-like protein 2 isoform X2 [Oratosquilla oratoria]|uniref:neuralized-like protein 2 isoform X2 n=1 Tax=Oratosquilla oratoria TaxID=337810 RepID=UPI003F7753A5
MCEPRQAVTRFHPHHGANVILNDDSTIAYRKASFANAVTLSERPLMPGEIFLVEIEKTEPGWTGHMRFGLTQFNPSCANSISKLPPYSLPDMTNTGNSWICAITKSHNRVQEDREEDDASKDGEEDEELVEGDEDEEEEAEKEAANGGLATQYSRIREVGRGSRGGGGGGRRRGGRGGSENRRTQGLETLMFGDHLQTSRGLVPKCALQPAPYVFTSPSGRKITLKRDNILPTDEGSRIGVIYIPKGELAEMHYIINGEDQGAFTKKLPYKEAPLFVVVDVYGTTKQVRIVQLYGVGSLKSACRDTILKHIAQHGVNALPLPRMLKDYLLFES